LFHTVGAEEQKLRCLKRAVHERGMTMSPWLTVRNRPVVSTRTSTWCH